MKPTSYYRKAAFVLGEILAGILLIILDTVTDSNTVSLALLIGVLLIHSLGNILLDTYIFYYRDLLSVLGVTILVQVIMYITLIFFGQVFPVFKQEHFFYSKYFLLTTVALLLYNSFIYWLYRTKIQSSSMAIIGPKEAVLLALENERTLKKTFYRVTHVIVDDYMTHLQMIENEVNAVYLVGQFCQEEQMRLMLYLHQKRKHVYLGVSFQQTLIYNPTVLHSGDAMLIESRAFEFTKGNAVVKRLVDIIVSAIILIITLPITLMTAILIKIDSPGSIFYTQDRVTLNHRVFKMIKFRSMNQDAERKTGPVLMAKNDNRVTKIGKFIRATRIDELPQLWNVLIGDMSLVGPRPERPFFVEQFEKANPYYSLRHHVRAGLTGYAQAYGNYATDFQSKLRFDLMYIKKNSLLFDVKLMLKTIMVLFDKINAQGVSEGEQTPLTWEEVEKQYHVVSTTSI